MPGTFVSFTRICPIQLQHQKIRTTQTVTDCHSQDIFLPPLKCQRATPTCELEATQLSIQIPNTTHNFEFKIQLWLEAGFQGKKGSTGPIESPLTLGGTVKSGTDQKSKHSKNIPNMALLLLAPSFQPLQPPKHLLNKQTQSANRHSVRTDCDITAAQATPYYYARTAEHPDMQLPVHCLGDSDSPSKFPKFQQILEQHLDPNKC